MSIDDNSRKQSTTYHIIDDKRLEVDFNLNYIFRKFARSPHKNLQLWKSNWKEWVHAKDIPIFKHLADHKADQTVHSSPPYNESLDLSLAKKQEIVRDLLCVRDSPGVSKPVQSMYSFFEHSAHEIQGTLTADTDQATYMYQPSNQESYLCFNVQEYHRIECTVRSESEFDIFLHCHQHPQHQKVFLESIHQGKYHNPWPKFPAHQDIKIVIDTKRKIFRASYLDREIYVPFDSMLPHLLHVYLMTNGHSLTFSNLGLGELAHPQEAQWPIPQAFDELHTVGTEWSDIAHKEASQQGFFLTLSETDFMAKGVIVSGRGFWQSRLCDIIYGRAKHCTYSGIISIDALDLAYLGPEWQDHWVEWADRVAQEAPEQLSHLTQNIGRFVYTYPHHLPEKRLSHVSEHIRKALVESYTDYVSYMSTPPDQRLDLLRQWSDERWITAQYANCIYACLLSNHLHLAHNDESVTLYEDLIARTHMVDRVHVIDLSTFPFNS